MGTPICYRGNPSGSSEKNPSAMSVMWSPPSRRQATRPKVIFFLAYACVRAKRWETNLWRWKRWEKNWAKLRRSFPIQIEPRTLHIGSEKSSIQNCFHPKIHDGECGITPPNGIWIDTIINLVFSPKWSKRSEKAAMCVHTQIYIYIYYTRLYTYISK